jgi:predicted RNA-binding protein with RPS1 domain
VDRFFDYPALSPNRCSSAIHNLQTISGRSLEDYIQKSDGVNVKVVLFDQKKLSMSLRQDEFES